MPQTTVIPAWKAEVPILTPAQKPGGVTISTTLIANAVPNKPQPWTATTVAVAEAKVEGEEVAPEEEEVHEEEEGTEEENDENGHPKPRTSAPRRGSQHRGRRR